MDEMERSTAEGVFHLPGGLLIEQANATQAVALADMMTFKAEGLHNTTDWNSPVAVAAAVPARCLTPRSNTSSILPRRSLRVGPSRRVGSVRIPISSVNDDDIAQLDVLLEEVHKGLKTTPPPVAPASKPRTQQKRAQAQLASVDVTAAFLAKVEVEARALK